MSQSALSDLTSPGTLRVGINLANILLVTGTARNGNPEGVAPGVAAAIAERLGLAVAYVTFATPGEVADGVERDEWDVCLIAEDPKRAETIRFCGAYVQIEATYLVPAGSPLQTIEDVDQPGIDVAVSGRSAYDLFLSRTLQHATLHRAKGLAGALELFKAKELDALAGLVPALRENADALPGSRVIDGRYMTVRQAIGTKPGNTALGAAIGQIIQDLKRDGSVAELVERYGVAGKLQVASED